MQSQHIVHKVTFRKGVFWTSTSVWLAPLTGSSVYLECLDGILFWWSASTWPLCSNPGPPFAPAHTSGTFPMVLGMAPRASHMLGRPAPCGTFDSYMPSSFSRDSTGQNVLFLQHLGATTEHAVLCSFWGLLRWGPWVPSLPYRPSEGSAVTSLGSPPFLPAHCMVWQWQSWGAGSRVTGLFLRDFNILLRWQSGIWAFLLWKSNTSVSDRTSDWGQSLVQRVWRVWRPLTPLPSARSGLGHIPSLAHPVLWFIFSGFKAEITY